MSILPVGIGSSGGYSIANSLRLRSSASAYLSRTFSGAGDRKTWTYSVWVKRSGIGANHVLLAAGAVGNSTDFVYIDISALNTLRCQLRVGGVDNLNLQSSQVLRDPSAWYHIVIQLDLNSATQADRFKMYINGDRVTSFSTNTNSLTSSLSPQVGNAQTHYIGNNTIAAGDYFDGYMAEINYVNGQALTPSSFGEFNTDGVWVPKRYNGTYGTNGFKLDFSNGTSTTTLGYDSSGNGNNWALNNVSLTSGATYDWLTDTPTNNYATLNPLDSPTGTFSAANLNILQAGASGGSRGSQALPANTKIYYELTTGNTTSAGCQVMLGVSNAAVAMNSIATTGTWGIYVSSSRSIATNGSLSSTAATIAAGTVLQFAIDTATGKAWVGIANAWYDTATTTNGNPAGDSNPTFTGLTQTLFPYAGVYANNADINFGQRPFAYTPPTGFKALCTANRPSGGSITTSGSFTGNASADGPFVWLNGNPETMTINGNAVTWGTHADKTAGGFKVRSSSASYNASGSNTFSVSVTGKLFGDITHAPNTAKGNP